MEGELDLDSLLDDFGPAAPVQTPSIHESKVGSKAIVSPAVEIIPQDKFLAELTSGMQILINEGVFNDPSEIEQLTKGLSQLSSKNVDIPATIAPSAEQDDGFQTKIKDTIDQLRRSDDGHSKFSQGSDSIFPNVEGGTITNHINFSGDMASMMKNFEGLMESGEFEGLFEGIFDQFVSRDLLYEPLKDLSSKYPTWIENNRKDTLSEDIARYVQQHAVILEIISVFDTSSEAEPNKEESERITELISKMQEFGNPPSELMPDMKGIEGLGESDDMPGGEQCPMQ